VFLGAAAVVALPWNLYAASRWPDAYSASLAVWFGHLHSGSAVAANILFRRPIDAIFNEIQPNELAPLPAALPLIGGSWLMARAFRRREAVVVGLGLWVLVSWIALSIAESKVPAVMWGAVPALLSGIALFGRAALLSPPAAFASAASWRPRGCSAFRCPGSFC